MRQAGGGQIKAGIWQRDKDKRVTARQGGRPGPSELVLVPARVRGAS